MSAAAALLTPILLLAAPLEEMPARRAQPVAPEPSEPLSEGVMETVLPGRPHTLPDEATAFLAGEHWLKLLDREAHEEAYSFAAPFLKSSLPEMKWAEVVIRQRKPLGKLLKRQMTFVQHRTFLPGAPPGRYLALHFRSRFEQRDTLEIVSLYQDSDNSWKVAGYGVEVIGNRSVLEAPLRAEPAVNPLAPRAAPRQEAPATAPPAEEEKEEDRG